ncbi:MAG: hypothetical protein AAF415_02230 [Pseudomonadota bacterium]
MHPAQDVDLTGTVVNIRFTKGDAKPVPVLIEDRNGEPIGGIANKRFSLTAKNGSGGLLFELPGLITDEDAAEVTFQFLSAHTNQDPGQYKYDVEMTDTEDATLLDTIMRGVIFIIEGVGGDVS